MWKSLSLPSRTGLRRGRHPVRRRCNPFWNIDPALFSGSVRSGLQRAKHISIIHLSGYFMASKRPPEVTAYEKC